MVSIPFIGNFGCNCFQGVNCSAGFSVLVSCIVTRSRREYRCQRETHDVDKRGGRRWVGNCVNRLNLFEDCYCFEVVGRGNARHNW